VTLHKSTLEYIEINSPGTTVVHTDTGSMKQKLMLALVEHVTMSLPELSEAEPGYLDLDWPSVHQSLDAIVHCNSRHLRVRPLPKDTSSWAQVADDYHIHGQLKAEFHKLLAAEELLGQGVVNLNRRVELLIDAWNCVSSQYVRRAFWGCGYPTPSPGQKSLGAVLQQQERIIREKTVVPQKARDDLFKLFQARAAKGNTQPLTLALADLTKESEQNREEREAKRRKKKAPTTAVTIGTTFRKVEDILETAERVRVPLFTFFFNIDIDAV